MKNLTPKQQRFVEEYLVDLNATRAYLRAGYKCSEEAARRNGARLLTSADIANAIANYRDKVSERVGRTIDDIMADALHITVEFVPPTRRAFDLDNAMARMKSGFDGLVDVLGVDDAHWVWTMRKAPAGTVGGFVRVGVEVMT